MNHTEDETMKICEILSKIFIEKKLYVVLQRDTIVAEKLTKTITMSQIGSEGAVVKEDEFLDPFIGMERAKANYNS